MEKRDGMVAHEMNHPDNGRHEGVSLIRNRVAGPRMRTRCNSASSSTRYQGWFIVETDGCIRVRLAPAAFPSRFRNANSAPGNEAGTVP